MTVPPPHVLAAFDIRDTPTPLDGGEGRSWYADGLVLKPTDDELAASWIADVLAKLPEDGFRVARPVRTRQGGWLAAGWTAYEHVDGRESIEGHFDERFAAAAALHTALEPTPWPPALDARD